MKNPRVAKMLGTEPWQLHSDTMMILRLEKIADNQKRIARYICGAELDRAIIEELHKIHTDISEAYNDVMKSYYNQDRQAAFQIEMTNNSRIEACNRLLERCTQSHGSMKSKSANSSLVAVAKIIENLKAASAEIRNMARVVLCYE